MALYNGSILCSQLSMKRHFFSNDIKVKGKGSPYSITERRVPELFPVLGSQAVGDVNHKPLRGLLPLLLLGEQRDSGCEQFA